MNTYTPKYTLSSIRILKCYFKRKKRSILISHNDVMFLKKWCIVSYSKDHIWKDWRFQQGKFYIPSLFSRSLDYHFFQSLQKHLDERVLKTHEEVEAIFSAFPLTHKAKDGIMNLLNLWNEAIDNDWLIDSNGTLTHHGQGITFVAYSYLHLFW